MTAGQAAFWRAWQKPDPDAPARFTPGRYVCPVGHPGGKRTLKVHYEGSRVSGHCFEAGCGWQQVIDRLGVRRQDLDDDGPARGGQLVGVYPTPTRPAPRCCASTATSARPAPVTRCGPAASGDGTTGAGARTHLLYRLPHVLDAVHAGERYLVDSEASADALFKASVVATTIAGKPGAQLRTSHIEWLRDGYVTIVARRDPAGRDHARLSRAALAEVAADVEVVEPNVNRPHATAADHLAAGLGLDDFAPLGIVEHSSTASGVVEGGTGITAIPVALEAGAELLADVEGFVGRCVYFASSAQAITAALFAAHAWAFEAAEVTPYLHVSSAEKRSGKTLLLDLLRLLCRTPLMAADTTAPALFRSIGNPPPTVLFDEVQELFGRSADDGQRELRAVLHAGYRLGGNVRRCVGEGGALAVADFPVFCPKVLAGTGKLPDMLADRSVPIQLKRKPRNAAVERFRRRDAEAAAEPLRRRLAGWAETAQSTLTAARPELPDELNDRQQDIWEPLLAIADAAGGDWPKWARAAAVELHGAADPDDSVGVLLLRHIRATFKLHGALDRITTAALLGLLVERDDGPWGEWWGADVDADRLKGPAVRLAKLLKPYGIAPKRLRFGADSDRGYERAAFAEPWALYCPEDGTDGTSQVRGHIRHGTADGGVPTRKPALTSDVPSVPSESAEPRLIANGGAPGEG
jgi:Protein of unknown function (DUF3631)